MVKQLKLQNEPGDDPNEVEAVCEQLNSQISKIKDLAFATKKGSAETEET